MKDYALLLLAVSVLACSSGEGNPGDLSSHDTPGEAGFAATDLSTGTDLLPDARPGDDIQDEDSLPRTPPDPTELTFGKFNIWAKPIEDYIAINAEELGHTNFMKEIFDLAVFEDRLYFGYGDANLNLGRNTPIEIRFFTDPMSTEYSFDFTTDEEQIDRYRIDGDLLMIPGVDATEDDFLGNAYLYPSDGEWLKSRTLQWAWHVHDVARIGDTIYACGSGGDGDDYGNSTVHAFVWVSHDGGENFDVLVDLEHPAPPGDQRNVHLLPLGQKLYVFGYFSDETSTTYATAYELADDALVPLEEFPAFFVTDSYGLSSKAGLLVGVHIEDPLRQGLMRVTPSGVEPVAALEGFTVLDLQPLPDGRAVILYVEGDAYPLQDVGGYKTDVGITTTGADLIELASHFPVERPASVAFWRSDLFMGMADGIIFRAAGK